MRRALHAWRRATALASLLGGLLGPLPALAGTTADCPPAPQPPSAEQARQLRQDATDHGFLWRISRDGHSSYLYGTLHVGRLEWVYPGPALHAAWDDTDVLALELDIANPDTAQQMQQALRQAPRPALSTRQRARLQRQVQAQCAAGMQDANPLMQAMTLSLLAARRDGLEPGFAQEVVLSAMARAAGRNVVGLETPAQQVDALPPRGRREAVALLEHSLQQLEDDSGRAVMRRLAEVWARSQLDELAHYDDWCDCASDAADRAMLQRLLDQRNPPMASRIAALHAGGQRVLAAVGALHMIGAKGLPRLLQDMGFEVEQLHPSR